MKKYLWVLLAAVVQSACGTSSECGANAKCGSEGFTCERSLVGKINEIPENEWPDGLRALIDDFDAQADVEVTMDCGNGESDPNIDATASVVPIDVGEFTLWTSEGGDCSGSHELKGSTTVDVVLSSGWTVEEAVVDVVLEYPNAQVNIDFEAPDGTRVQVKYAPGQPWASIQTDGTGGDVDSPPKCSGHVE